MGCKQSNKKLVDCLAGINLLGAKLAILSKNSGMQSIRHLRPWCALYFEQVQERQGGSRQSIEWLINFSYELLQPLAVFQSREERNNCSEISSISSLTKESNKKVSLKSKPKRRSKIVFIITPIDGMLWQGPI